MLLKVDSQSTQTLHDQVAGQLRRIIAKGDLHAGQKLPPARELAESLDINVHTLLRAYKTLQNEGLLEVRRGRGTTVTGAAPGRAEFISFARDLVAAARRAGLTDHEIRQALEAQL